MRVWRRADRLTSVRMLRRIRRRGAAALDRVFSSSQPNLDDESCGGGHLQFAATPPNHRRSSSLGSAALEHTCGRGQEAGGGTYELEAELRRGRKLAVRDGRAASSDPYVTFRMGGREVFRSRTVRRNLDPVWNQKTTLLTPDLSQPLHVKVFDYDFGLQDDFMGSAVLHLDALELNRLTPVTLILEDPRHPDEDLGSLELAVKLALKNATAEQRGDSAAEAAPGARRWRGLLSVALVEGRDLLPMDPNGSSDPYVKFRLGAHKYRSKTLAKTLSPRWREHFVLPMAAETADVLEASVWDRDSGLRDDFMGRCQLDLSTLAKEQTHRLELPLDQSRGRLLLLVTLTASAAEAANGPPDDRAEILGRYGPLKSFRDLKDVGAVQVKVVRAEGLMAADMMGKSDPFCVLELDDQRLQTQSVRQELNPHWNKVFTLKVKDIHSVLEVTVLDQDGERGGDFLGKVAIPLLHVRSGEQKAYALKDKELKGRSKGVIFLELHVVFNVVKAALRTLLPAERKLMAGEAKVSKELLYQNFVRVRSCVTELLDLASWINGCFRWESPARSLAAFLVFVAAVWNFQLFMLPLALLLLLVWKRFLQCARRTADTWTEATSERDEDDKEEAESRGLLDKLNAAQDVLISAQNALDQVASYGERLKNVFNWTVPFLSCLAVVALCFVAFLLYVLPLRYLVLAWGINKFTKKLRNPYGVDNNELLDFLSRVPSDIQVMQYRQPTADDATQSPGKRKRTNPG